ncbi:MAG: tetratricopeptide repeat protein [Pseudomonadota bacterium]
MRAGRATLVGMRILICLAFLCGPALAETCPPSDDISNELGVLIDKAREAKNETDGRAIANEMWQVWLRAPNAQAQALLDRGMGMRRVADYLAALSAFNRLIDYCPDYAEGYNQRAFVHFLQGNFPAALPDLDTALSLSPNHVGAQSGRALTLMNMGDLAAARTQMQAALNNNPWLSERALLAPGAPLGPEGEDI